MNGMEGVSDCACLSFPAWAQEALDSPSQHECTHLHPQQLYHLLGLQDLDHLKVVWANQQDKQILGPRQELLQ